LRDGQWWLEDLGSRNGTFVNNRRVAEPTTVQAGDLLGIGRVLLRLEV
jgi:pSer/pThr/pTyr-binding forkhead associated (FHA) protein